MRRALLAGTVFYVRPIDRPCRRRVDAPDVLDAAEERAFQELEDIRKNAVDYLNLWQRDYLGNPSGWPESKEASTS